MLSARAFDPTPTAATITHALRLDAHQHFWRFPAEESARRADFGWIDDSMEVLRRDYLPEHLAPELAAHAIDASLAVQARQSLEETRFLLDLARDNERIAGVVGWVDLRHPGVERELDLLASEPKLVGLRHIVQDEPDDEFLLRSDFQRGVSYLEERGLAYDILVYPRQLPAAVGFVERFPDQTFVLDHLAKPALSAPPEERNLAAWESAIRALAEHPKLACKISGLVTEAAWQRWTPADFAPVLDVVFEAFGPDRLLFGSDWPVCLLAARDYGEVVSLVADYATSLAPSARAQLFGENARAVYALGETA